jgi:polysaccharide export outer membrane protein
MEILAGWSRPGVVLFVAAIAACWSHRVPGQEAPPAQTHVGNEYVIGPGDTLSVFVWRQPELTVTVPVRPDGRISTPLVGDVTAVGKTPSQLEQEIEGELAEFIRTPEVNIIVQAVAGVSGAQIRVLGQVAQPRSVPFREGITLMDVVIEAGGLTEFAAGNRSRVVRTVDGETQEIRVRLDDLMRKGRIKENLVMQPGDVLTVPEAVF